MTVSSRRSHRADRLDDRVRARPVLRRGIAVGVVCLAMLAGCSSSGSSGRTTTSVGAAGSTTVAGDHSTGAGVSVSDARIPVPASADVAAVYLTVTNHTDATDTLESVTTDAGGTAELHKTSDDNGTMTMGSVGAVDIAAGGTLVLKPGSYHIMIMNPTKPLALGDSVAVTLHLSHAGAVKVDAKVVDPTSVVSGDSGTGHTGDMSDMD